MLAPIRPRYAARAAQLSCRCYAAAARPTRTGTKMGATGTSSTAGTETAGVAGGYTAAGGRNSARSATPGSAAATRRRGFVATKAPAARAAPVPAALKSAPSARAALSRGAPSPVGSRQPVVYKVAAASTKPGAPGAPRPPSVAAAAAAAAARTATPAKTAAATAPRLSQRDMDLRSAAEREAALRAARLRRREERTEEQLAQAKAEDEAAAKAREFPKRYKRAARKWVSSVVAMPVLLVTSYYLFDRLALGHEVKPVPELYRRPADQARD